MNNAAQMAKRSDPAPAEDLRVVDRLTGRGDEDTTRQSRSNRSGVRRSPLWTRKAEASRAGLLVALASSV